MRIAYCTLTDPYNMQSWSGLHNNILRSLQKHFDDVVVLGPLKNKYLFIAKNLDRIIRHIFRRNSTYLHSSIISKEYARQLLKKLKDIDADILFFPGGSEIIAYLETDIPIVYLTDSTYESMIDYYQSYSNLLPLSRKMGNFVEHSALRKSAVVIFASEWAKNAAIKDYDFSTDKISVFPFGANIDKIPERKKILGIRKKDFPVLKLLLVGINWERKGCQIAVDTMIKLNDRGIETELTICGCKPPKKINHEHLHIIKFLNKNNYEDAQKINRLYEEANIFIFPTRSECAGIVICEACAYGLPVIATDTGGVSTYVKNGINGHTLPFEATADSYADIIESYLLDKNSYYHLAESSRNKFENDLNWDVWGQEVKNLLTHKYRDCTSPVSSDILESTKITQLDTSNPILIISQPRSGSTLLQKLLHNHQDIATTGETWALLPILYGDILSNININKGLAFDGPLAEKAIHCSLSELNNPKEAIKEVLRDAYLKICSKHTNEQSAKFFLDKTPRYYYIIDEILRNFEASKILLLIRNPLSVLSSILTTWVNNDYFLLINYKDDLLLAPKILAETLKKNHPNVYPVYYEQLIKDPRNQLKNICNFFNIDFNESLLKPDNEKKWFFGDQTNIYKQNIIFENYQKLKLKIKSRQDWRLHSDYLDCLGPDLIKSLGYDFAEHRLMLDEMKPKFSFNVGLKFYTSNLFKSAGRLTAQKRLLKKNISAIYKLLATK